MIFHSTNKLSNPTVTCILPMTQQSQTLIRYILKLLKLSDFWNSNTRNWAFFLLHSTPSNRKNLYPANFLVREFTSIRLRNLKPTKYNLFPISNKKDTNMQQKEKLKERNAACTLARKETINGNKNIDSENVANLKIKNWSVS